jgi:transposase InsO family protein
MIALAGQYGRYGYRRIAGLLWQEGWKVSKSGVERIWKLEGLEVPQEQSRRARLWFADGSCIRLRPLRRNHVWSWDFVMDRSDDGRPLKILTLIDEDTREALAIYVARRIRTNDVIDILADVMVERGVPEYIRSDNGPEMVDKSLRTCVDRVDAKTLYIEPGSPWENGYCESSNGKLRDELLNGEIFYMLREAQVLIEQWRQHCNRIRPHSALGYRPPAPESRGLAPVPRAATQRLVSAYAYSGPRPSAVKYRESIHQGRADRLEGVWLENTLNWRIRSPPGSDCCARARRRQ